MNEKIELFRTFTMDPDIEESEIIKFINWGKGDVQQALNYYYRHLEKGKIKRKPKPSPQPPLQRQKLSEAQFQALQKQPAQKIEQKKQRESQRVIMLDISDDSSENSQDAFSLLRKGSVKHQKTYDFIDKVRRIYQLPIKGKPQQELIRNSQSSVLEADRQMYCQSFDMVDCLADSFDPKKLEELTGTADKLTPGSPSYQKHNKQQISISQEDDDLDFKNLEDYQYKHVYTNKQCSPESQSKQVLPKSNQKLLPEKLEPEDQHQKQYKFQQVEEPLPKKMSQVQSQPVQRRATRASSKRVAVEKIQTKQTKLEVIRNASEHKPTKKIVPPPKKQQVKDLDYVDPYYPFCQKMDDDEIFAGEYFVNCFSTEKKKFDRFYQGCPIQVVGYMEDLKTKKKNFGKKQEPKMHMRLYHEDKAFGRIHDNEVRILMPLIDAKLIRAEYYIHEFPLFADTFKPITIKARIYFLPKFITEPIVENFEPNQNDKERVHQISGLLAKLGLPLLVEPLVKGRSKYIRAAPKKKANESIDLMNYKKYEEEEAKKREMDAQAAREIIKMRTDPNYKPMQKSIKDMMIKPKSFEAQKPEQNNHDRHGGAQIQIGSLVKKKVIQIDTKADKDKYSQLIELHEEDLEPYFPKQNFVSNLYNYQALALSWMLKKQGFSQVKKEEEEIHPLWSEYQIPTCPKYRLFFNQLTGQVCVRRPKSKIQCKGGILADQMGLGKTVMMAALIVSHAPEKKLQSSQGGTLVIVPLTLLSQWESELAKHTKGIKSLIYYSGERKKFSGSLHQYDVVISTYGTVSHEFAQGCHIKKTGVYKYKWHRIILDEAHYIKGRIIQTSKAVYELAGQHRWCLTGTPIQNTAADLFSLIHFIKYTPWSEFACWSRFISKPLEDGDESIYGVIRTILKRVFLRRTKNSEDSNGKPIVELPPRISKVELLTMSQKQRQFYDSVYAASKSDFDGLIDKGILEAKYMQVLEMLMRLRQICCHPILFKSVTKFTRNVDEFESELRRLIERIKNRKAKGQGSQSDDEYYEPVIDADNEEQRIKTSNPQKQIPEEYFKETVSKVQRGDLDCCIICLNKPEDPVINSCLHIFCKSCNIRQIQEQGFCAFCRTPLVKESFIYLPRENRLNTKFDDIFLSTKMIALKEHLSNLGATDKVVVFSQFLGMLDLLENEFKKLSFKYVRMEGSNTHKQRTKIVNSFQNDPSVQIFLVSLKTAGVGLNLVAANKVFLLDPWWNPAVEEQAIERVHRIGQKRTVEIYRFIMDRTIETRMLELNTEKKQLSQNLLGVSNTEEHNSRAKVEKLKYLMQNY